MTTMAAVDLGASSGRVIRGTLSHGRIELNEVARFPNGAVAVPTGHGERLHWDVLRLWAEIVNGVRVAGPVDSIGIDTWAVDYALLDGAGALIGYPSAYRCDRNRGAAERFFDRMPAHELYGKVGLQRLPFNTIFQLAAEERVGLAETLLLLPDLLSYWLTGVPVAEVTNASTTGLLDPCTRQWRTDVLDELAGMGRDVARLLPRLVEPGEVLGPTRASLQMGDKSASVVAVGSHDTASAVVGVPAVADDFAYISCGTWSLVGVELPAPVLSREAFEANITNELGVDGTTRFLKNVMGLWVLGEAVRQWRGQGHDVTYPRLIAAASEVPGLVTVVDIDDPVFLPPGDMPARIADVARRTRQPVPSTRGEVARCVIDSLALAYRRVLRQVVEASGREVSVVHMVGGGIQNRLLCQLTADATGLPVVAGPAEATALGNLAVQARAVGALRGGLAELRDVVRASAELARYEPRGDEARWDAAQRRVSG